MGRRHFVHVFLACIVAASVLLPITAASAAIEFNGGVTPLLDLREGESLVDVSQDLSTVVTRNDGNADGFESLYVIDLATSGRIDVTGTDRRLDQVRNDTSLTADGGELILTASWPIGDSDLGLSDVFVVDAFSGTFDNISSDFANASVTLSSHSADGSRVLLNVNPVFGPSSTQFHLWDEGVTTQLDLGDNVWNAILSDDGTAVIFERTIGFDNLAYRHDIATNTTELIGAGIGNVRVASRDGSIVVGQAGQGFVVIDGTSIIRTVEPGSMDYAAFIGSADDGSSIVFVQWSYEVEEPRIRRLDTDTGTISTLIESTGANGGYFFNFLQVFQVDVEGREFVFVGSRGLPNDRRVSYYDEEQQQTVYRFDADGAAASMNGVDGSLRDELVRLYRAYFGRAADAAGLDYWLDRRSEGVRLEDVSSLFADSPEFAQTYGALDDEAFIDLVYLNVLGRIPDAAGRAYWLELLGLGLERGSLMTLFSQSPEFVNTTGTLPPKAADQAEIERLFFIYFDREIDASGLEHWLALRRSGVPMTGVAEEMAKTDEFGEYYGRFDIYFFMEAAYQNVLGVYPWEAGEQAFYDTISALEAGLTTKAQVLLDLANRPEVIKETLSTPPGG